MKLHPDARQVGAEASPRLVGLPFGQETIIATVLRRAGAAAGARVRPARRGADVRKSHAAGTPARVFTPAPAAGGALLRHPGAPPSLPCSPPARVRRHSQVRLPRRRRRLCTRPGRWLQSGL